MKSIEVAMARLKPRAEILLPDIRNRNRGNLDHSTGMISEMTIESFYDELKKIELQGAVPECVQSHFATAKNLVLYSWFVYPFNMVAALHAFASLEMAVKEKTGDRKTSLRKQLDQVLKGRKLSGGMGPPIDLSIVISKLRNDLAHGSPTIHGLGLMFVDRCAALINELFV
jgi:hypothetical protein